MLEGNFSMSTDHNPARAAMDAYADAVYAKDLEAFAALYAKGVHVFDSWGQWQYDGIGAWRGMAAGWFSSLGDERVEVRFGAVSSTVGAEVAFGSAGVWKITHEHSSLPIDMATGKGIFTPGPA